MSELRPRLRDSVLVFSRDDLLQFVGLADLRVLEFRVQPFVHGLVLMLDGTWTRAEIVNDVCTRFEVTADDVGAVLEVLAAERLLLRSAPDPTPHDYRFERQERFFDELIASHDELPPSARSLQRRLETATVVVLGVGGAGGWVAQALAAAGIGRLDLVDPDTVAATNLNRQVLYSMGDLGREKVEVAAEQLRRLNPDLEVRALRQRINTSEDVRLLLPDVDLIVSCADEPSVYEVSDLVAQAAQAAGTPHIVGGAYGANLGVPGISVVPGVTTCWACARADAQDDNRRSSMTPVLGRRRTAGTIAPIAGLVGNLIAWEAMRMLLGMPLGLAGTVRELDVMTLEWRTRKILPRSECPDCPSSERFPPDHAPVHVVG